MCEVVSILQDTFDTMMKGITRESERAKAAGRNKVYEEHIRRIRDFATQVAETQLRREILQEQRVGEQNNGSGSDSDDENEDLDAVGACAVAV